MAGTTPTASPNVKSTIGLQGFVIAPITSDTAAGITYGTAQKVAGIISASVTPANSDPAIQYADDIEFDVLYYDPDVSLKTKLADLPLAIQEMIYGAKIDDNGVLINNANDTPGYYAVGFKAEKTNHKYRYVWLYKCRAKLLTDAYATKEGGNTITRQEPEVEWTAIKRTYDGDWRAVVDEDENGVTAQTLATFLDAPYVKSVTNT